MESFFSTFSTSSTAALLPFSIMVCCVRFTIHNVFLFCALLGLSVVGCVTFLVKVSELRRRKEATRLCKQARAVYYFFAGLHGEKKEKKKLLGKLFSFKALNL